MDSSLYFWIIIRFSAAHIQSDCDIARLHSNGSVRPRLDDFIRNLKLSSVFISLVNYDHYFIPNVVIVIYSCGFFAKLRVFRFMLVSADVCISNSIYDLLGVSSLTQKLIGPEFLFSPTVRTLFCEICCRQDSHTWVSII